MTTIFFQMKILLQQGYSPIYLEIHDVTSSHRGHREGGHGQETHFNILIVSEAFAGKKRLERHRSLHHTLKNLFLHKIHALSFQALTPYEYQNFKTKLGDLDIAFPDEA